jgi:hypothetical protein
MTPDIFAPNSRKQAAQALRTARVADLTLLPKPQFLTAWCAIAYLLPGLHPDGYESEDSGWPRSLKRFAAEAWRRLRSGELMDEELYPCDAQWAGLFDLRIFHTPVETQRRVKIAARYGRSFEDSGTESLHQ